MSDLDMLLEELSGEDLARAQALCIVHMVRRFGALFVLGVLHAQAHALAAQSLEGGDVVGWVATESTEMPL